jgi:hypothetical protein
MRATRAYIASAGTAVVMLGASVCLFALVSAFVAFGNWPGAESHSRLDQVLLRDVVRAKPAEVAVRSDAVVIARRAAQRAAAQRQAARVTPAGTPVAIAPAVPGAPGGARTTPTQPASSTPAAAPKLAQPGNSDVGTTAGDVTQQVQQQVQDVQTQVNDVVGQVIGGPQADTNGPVQDVTGGAKNAAGSLLGG